MRINLLCVLLFALCTGACAQNYSPALPGYHYEFPRDHFNHPEYQTEWWYYTGNVRGKDGHRFGFELTFFRQGISRDANSSPWYVHDLYMAHLALTDVNGGRYYATERLNRAGPGIAGVDAVSGTVWNGNWQTRIGEGAHELRGIGENFSLELHVTPQKQPVIQGTNGVSQKAEGVGNASHYISFTRMKTAGTIELNGTQFAVDGDTWMDHEFFSDSINDDEVGWDWLSVQLDDNSELMLYRLRHKDGSVDPYSSGTFVDREGKAVHLALRDFTMTQKGATWKSQQTGAQYPIAWSVTVPQLKLQIEISTPLKSQEFVSRVGPSYWEGTIDIIGRREDKAVHGAGYLEMTGYSESNKPIFSVMPR
ncbi:MAG: lipocalin-like domain-containing protein [Janthinobacterium lividum]